MSSLLQELDTVLDCESENLVIEGFMDRYEVTYEEAADIFEQTKKWLWLASKTKDVDEEGLFMDRSLLIIDEMWHTFILHTKQYYKFCFDHFKRFIHHVPTSRMEKLKVRQDYEERPYEMTKKYEERLKRQYGLIYDELGPDTLLKWYNTLAKKYTPEYIKSIKKK